MTELHDPTPGRPDECFEHDGLITKREVRAIAFAQLRPRPGQLLWDLGLGSGAVAIEWCLAAEGARAVGLEKKPERLARAQRNITRFGLDDRIDARLADVADIDGLPAPDAVFIGGGATTGVAERAWQSLRPGGRMVVHGVTVEAEQLCLELYREHGGELTRVAIEHAEPIGRFTGFRPLRTITCWAATAPTDPTPEEKP